MSELQNLMNLLETQNFNATSDNDLMPFKSKSKNDLIKAAVLIPIIKRKNCFKVISIGNKILFLENYQNRVCFYDVDKNEWSEKPCEVAKYLQCFAFVKVPCL